MERGWKFSQIILIAQVWKQLQAARLNCISAFVLSLALALQVDGVNANGAKGEKPEKLAFGRCRVMLVLE